MTDDPTDTEAGPRTNGAAPALGHPLRSAVLELERHAAASGWDQAAQLFALVTAERVLADDPDLAGLAGVTADSDPATLIPVEQPIDRKEIPSDYAVEDLLAQIEWPGEVAGSAVIVERLVLPPTVEDVPDRSEEATAFAQSHPDREEVRIVAAALRGGATYCAMRLRSRDDDFAIIEAQDLVPELLELLQVGLADGPTSDAHRPVRADREL